MTVATQLNRIRSAIDSAFSAVETRGGVVESRNSSDLAAAIFSIPSADGSSGGLPNSLDFYLGNKWLVCEDVIFPSKVFNWITRGPDKFVGVGNLGLLMYSFDGLTWTTGLMPKDSGSNITWGHVAWINDRYVATSTYGAGTYKPFAYSFDGINWNLSTTDAGKSCQFTKVVYGNGIYATIDVNYYFKPFLSYDGVSWATSQNETLDGTVSDVTFTNGKFFLCNGKTFYATTDFETVTTIRPSNPPATATWIDSYENTIVAYGPKVLIVSKDGGDTWSSMSPSSLVGANFSDEHRPMHVKDLWMFVTIPSKSEDPGIISYTKDFVHWKQSHYPLTHRTYFNGWAYDGEKLLVAVSQTTTPLISIGPFPETI